MKKQITLIKEAALHWNAHRASRMGAAVAYYAIFSLIPLFVLLVSIASIFFTRTEVIANLSAQLTTALGPSVSQYVTDAVSAVAEPNLRTAGAIVGAAVLLFIAIGTISEINSDLEELWLIPKKTREKKKKLGQIIAAYVAERASFFLLILIGALLLIFSVAFSFLFDGNTILENAVTFSLSIVGFMALYRLLPTLKLPYHELLDGAALTALLFVVGKRLIGLYLSNTSQTTYGAAGSFIAILIWIYYCAQVLLFAASWIFVRSKKYGYLSRQQNR
jgi:membrane protein